LATIEVHQRVALPLSYFIHPPLSKETKATDYDLDKSVAVCNDYGMTIPQFARWLREQFDLLDDLDPEDGGALAYYDGCASTSRKVGQIALKMGLMEVYQCTQTRLRSMSPSMAREILGECLSKLPREPKETITIEELQELTGWSRTTIWRRRNEGKIPEPHMNGGRLYWLRSDLAEIL
jgi:predicted DNA-binding transcriptional regulator AlpA